jgi:hypothetical protein
MHFDANGWLDEAIEIDYLQKSMPRAGWKPLIIVIHGTAGFDTAEAVGNFFRDSTVEASTHFVIGKDGAIVQGVPVSLAAWGNGGLSSGHVPFLPANVNPNLYTVSIEHVKNQKNAAGQFDNSDQLTDAQKLASFRLIDCLCSTYGMKRQFASSMDGGMLYHRDIDPVNKPLCPGPYPEKELIAYLQRGSSMQVPQGWKDDGITLTAPNGVPVVLGFRDFILTHPWDPGNYPLAREEGRNPLEVSNPGLGAGTQQLFRLFPLEWTQDRGVFPAWGGQEIQTLRAIVANLQQQLATQNSELVARLKQIHDLSTF